MRPNDNLIKTVNCLLTLLKVRVTRTSVEKLKLHPQYPNLQCLSDSLREWNINSLGVKLTSQQLHEIPYPAIAHMNKHGGHFVVLKKIETNRVYYFDSDTGTVDESVADFEKKWCGVVMQDGYIFSDTIARNIALSGETIDRQKLLHAVTVANIKAHIETLPLGYNTKIGANGSGLSQGQKQRLLIARAVYKNPEFIFFDEATSSLDANNEKTIMENLDEFFKARLPDGQGKTVLVIAHRLSTVKNADQIVVLEKGKIVETGTHAELTRTKGKYYELVKNQLELGT